MINDKNRPPRLQGKEYYYDSFTNNEVLLGKKKGHLPAMGWNSWNAFGSGNTAELTKIMADKIVELGLDKLGYKYVVLDDGCYKPERVEDKLSNETKKFPEGFKALSDYIHAKGLKFGMYNDIGTNLCAGAAVGTYAHEDIDAQSYIDWGVDFLKVDNCYYLWDNATYSAATNAKYVYAPKIKGIRVVGKDYERSFSAVTDGLITGEGCKVSGGAVMNIGTFDGTNVGTTPVGVRSGELEFNVLVPETEEYEIYVTYATGEEIGVGSWLQLAIEKNVVYDDFLPVTENVDTYAESDAIKTELTKGDNRIRIMNHRRQENTLNSYATLLEGLNKAKPDHDVIFSICEWGKTQPQNWGYKVGDSWRILNDITFRVGSDGDPGIGTWFDNNTASVTSQYNKAVIMGEFAGLSKGWNDPDMLMVGMNGLDETMCKTHMVMWCMMNSPLMLGLDLRRVQKGDALWNIIANQELIMLNQDALGVQAKRLYTTMETDFPDTDYITNNERCDILVKPLADGSIAISFINLNDKAWDGEISVDAGLIAEKLGGKMVNPEQFKTASAYMVKDMWSGEVTENKTGVFTVKHLEACESITIRVTVTDIASNDVCK
ncbi:MAG: alpha-galactosidase [Lachnospiraceae bacterium]|nr:alpha-galactosidase [Lachnospiraceae bacterium]